MDDCQTEPRFFLAHSPAKVPKTCETSGFWMFSQLRSIQKNLGPSLTAHLLGSSHDCHRLHFHIISTMEPKQINQNKLNGEGMPTNSQVAIDRL